MKSLPSEESILSAYDAVSFDERTPDERGFGEIFENEFKPRLKERAAQNLHIERVQRRRKTFFTVILAVVAVSFFPFSAALFLFRDGVAFQVLYGAVAVVVIGVFVSGFLRGGDEKDPTQAAMLTAILKQFNCRFEAAFYGLDPVASGATVLPPYSEFQVYRGRISGSFDERIPFSAVRLSAMLREGKSASVTFTGWYLRVDLPFSFSGKTVIREKYAASKFGDGRIMPEVSLEDPGFARRFSVYSNDQVEARVILAPDVMEHLNKEADRLEPEGKGWNPAGDLLLGFSGSHAHVWLPSRGTVLTAWTPLDPPEMVENLHDAFAELSAIRGLLRDIDVIAEAEGFRAQAARNARSSGTS